jgi:hypothetical protein
MTTSALLTKPPEGRFYPYAQGVNADLKTGITQFSKKDNGTLTMKDVPVFRSGTFRDSWGEQKTWSPEDIDLMVEHYEKLTTARLFDDVPVRDGHPGFMSIGPGAGEVVGWHTGVRAEVLEAHDGTEYNYLLADFEMTEPHAAGKVERRTWRNRSAEIGTYATNGDVEYSPVYMGFAYVDIPAVEGLKINGHSHFNKASGNRFFFMAGRDSSVSDTSTQPGTGTPPAQPPATPPTTPPATPPPSTPPPSTPPTSPPAPGVPAPGVTPPAQHTAPTQVLEFRVNGAPVSDFAAVQRHIDTLEQFQRETADQSRRDYVAALASDNKIVANPETIAAMEAFALGLQPAQFTAWKATWDAAPGNPALQQHGVQTGGTPGTNEREDRIAVLKETIQQHTYAGMAKEKLEQLPSYKELQTLMAQA